MTLYFKNSILLISFILSLVSSSSWAELSAKVDRSVLDSNETLGLELNYDGQVFTGEPDFSVLTADFEILSNNRQQSYTRTNGQATSFTAWTLQLRPKRAGILLIPSISFKGDVSNAVELRVRAAPTNPSAANPGSQPIYTETLVDNETVYVNQQIILTHRLYTSINLRDYSLSELKIDDAILHRLGDTTYQKVLNGRNYLVLEVKYAVFPKNVGKINVPKLRFGAYEVNSRSQFGVFNNRGNQVIRDTETVSVNVLAQPIQANARGWMPSSSVDLQQRWSGDLNNLTVGEPITRTLTIAAAGLSSAQITPLTAVQSNLYRSYPDQPQLTETISSSGLVGTRIESLALVPNKPGDIVLPAIELRWWDTGKQREQVARLPAMTLQVKPMVISATQLLDSSMGNMPIQNMAEGATLQAITSSSKQTSTLTQISLTLNALMIALVVILLLRYKNQARSVRQYKEQKHVESARLSLKQHLKTIQEKAKSDNLMGMRDAILVWGQVLFTKKPPATLKALAICLEDADIGEQFEQLDRQLYQGKSTGGATLDIELLLTRLKTQSTFSRKSGSKQQTGRALKSLYPE